MKSIEPTVDESIENLQLRPVDDRDVKRVLAELRRLREYVGFLERCHALVALAKDVQRLTNITNAYEASWNRVAALPPKWRDDLAKFQATTHPTWQLDPAALIERATAAFCEELEAALREGE